MTHQDLAEASKKKYPKINITIDSKTYTVRDDDWEAGALLRLAGLDPVEYDLAQIKKNGQLKRFKDGHVVKVEDGDEFESVKQDGPVA
ncbi:endonuclease YncB(thermonuclease family) [Cryobacterium mesophilum]|jgi:endonuclease YncB( thermonuclease family)|uniref:Multiubiquitin n=1 Tax=Terrimesophilobacter mesophilus TaxID=433647 RepID=A0A4R8VCR5_9MICO|nr:hypothetical protein [Terrimesophilobacter mesophilus]MBB5633136.1 endonuclease YncB(thermonuclease family) [Terrimesophilobacter mesophilus]TFB79892.1 hypothetical protein E3N84_07445 [Terrimesophilobacter mesophilus]